ncbi:unnamed protein product, partial [Choristocarpus tenellus]
GEDGVVLSFDLRSSTDCDTTLIDKQESILSIALHPLDPHYLYICGNSEYLELWDQRSTAVPVTSLCPKSLRGSGDHITGCAVNWSGSEVLATYNPSGAIYRFD